MGPANDSPLCAARRLTGHVDLLTKTRSPSVWVNAGVKHCSNRIFHSLLVAHLSKVMAWKIWMSLKGNRDYKSIIHFLSYCHCHHCLDRLTLRVTRLLISHKWCRPNEWKAIIKASFSDGCQCYHAAAWFHINPNHCSYHDPFQHSQAVVLGVSAVAGGDSSALRAL